MSRFTAKLKNGEYAFLGNTLQECQMINEFGQLEDIEEEIGIDLITKNKVEKSTYCYWKDKNNELYEFVINKSERIGVLIEDYDGYRCLLLYKDYGKTWALTKEELLND